jgi:hypothetical protein
VRTLLVSLAVALLAGCPGSTAADGGTSSGVGGSTAGGTGGSTGGATSGGSNGGSTGGSANTQSCTDYANALCGLYQSCSNGWDIGFEFGDLPTCVTSYETFCLNRLATPDSVLSATQVETCAQDLPQESCENLYGSDNTAPCEAADGPLANGSTCTVNAQCQSAFCALSKYAVCGSCATQPAPGADCSTITCGVGLICLKGSQTCSAPVADGGACTSEADCQFGLSCLDGDGGLFACAPTVDLGQPCDYRSLVGPGCSGREGLYCKRDGDGGSCTPLGLADAGQPCGDVGGLATDCSAAGLCQKAQPDAGEGLCLGSAATGQACDIDAGPSCLLESKCVPTSATGTTGVCMQPAPSSCP